ncbi:hypothetical protein ACWIUD_06970 [Helicobacter sp. 23-1044]
MQFIKSRNDKRDSPSLAEGARGWVKFNLSSLRVLAKGKDEAIQKLKKQSGDSAFLFYSQNLPNCCYSRAKRKISQNRRIAESNRLLRHFIPCNDEVVAESAICTLICHFERSEKSQNKRDSSPTAQNDKIIDCHDFATQNLAMTIRGEICNS